MRLERDKREKAELELQDLNLRHTAVLSKLERLQGSVESLQYEKELQKGVGEEIRKLKGAQKEAQHLAQSLLVELRPCSADVQAQTEFLHWAKTEASKRELLEKSLQEVWFHAVVFFVCVVKLSCQSSVKVLYSKIEPVVVCRL